MKFLSASRSFWEDLGLFASRVKNQFEWLGGYFISLQEIWGIEYILRLFFCACLYISELYLYTLLNFDRYTRRRVSSIFSKISFSHFILHLLILSSSLSLSQFTPFSLSLYLSPNSRQESTIGCSSSHLINNPPTMSTPSGSHLINDPRRASQCR